MPPKLRTHSAHGIELRLQEDPSLPILRLALVSVNQVPLKVSPGRERGSTERTRKRRKRDRLPIEAPERAHVAIGGCAIRSLLSRTHCAPRGSPPRSCIHQQLRILQLRQLSSATHRLSPATPKGQLPQGRMKGARVPNAKLAFLFVMLTKAVRVDLAFCLALAKHGHWRIAAGARLDSGFTTRGVEVSTVEEKPRRSVLILRG